MHVEPRQKPSVKRIECVSIMRPSLSINFGALFEYQLIEAFSAILKTITIRIKAVSRQSLSSEHDFGGFQSDFDRPDLHH